MSFPLETGLLVPSGGHPMMVPGKVVCMGFHTTPQGKRARVGLVVNARDAPE